MALRVAYGANNCMAVGYFLSCQGYSRGMHRCYRLLVTSSGRMEVECNQMHENAGHVAAYTGTGYIPRRKEPT